MQSLRLFILAMRPAQWSKNLLLFSGIIFGGHLLEVHRLLLSVAGFFVFCGLAGVVYILNDLLDLKGDRIHPKKKHRPLASGQLAPRYAVVGATVVTGLSLGAAAILSLPFTALSLAYLMVMILYSCILKHMVIADLLVVAGGFVLRAVAGLLVVAYPTEKIQITPWFLSCLFFGALFIVVCKRRHEVVLLSGGARSHRPVLEDYPLPLLDAMICVASSACILSYSLYAIVGPAESRQYGELMLFSIPLVLYGIFRYLYLVYQRHEGGSPEYLLLKDRPILFTVILWLCLVGIVYTSAKVSP